VKKEERRGPRPNKEESIWGVKNAVLAMGGQKRKSKTRVAANLEKRASGGKKDKANMGPQFAYWTNTREMQNMSKQTSTKVRTLRTGKTQKHADNGK